MISGSLTAGLNLVGETISSLFSKVASLQDRYTFKLPEPEQRERAIFPCERPAAAPTHQSQSTMQ